MGSEQGTWIRLSESKSKSEYFPLDKGSEIKINPFCFKIMYNLD